MSSAADLLPVALIVFGLFGLWQGRTIVPPLLRAARRWLRNVGDAAPGVLRNVFVGREPMPRPRHAWGLHGKLRAIQRRLRRVAEGAIVAHRVGKHPHRVEERIDRDAFERLDVLEGLVGQDDAVGSRWRWWRGLRAKARCAHQTHRGQCCGPKECPPRSELHVVSLSAL